MHEVNTLKRYFTVWVNNTCPCVKTTERDTRFHTAYTPIQHNRYSSAKCQSTHNSPGQLEQREDAASVHEESAAVSCNVATQHITEDSLVKIALCSSVWSVVMDTVE
jgi:hypothetical protein